MLNTLRFVIQGIIAVALIAGGIGLAKLIHVETPADEEDRARGPLVQIQRVKMLDSWSTPITTYGTARAPRIYSIRPQVSGKVIDVSRAFDEGKKVPAGAVLFQVEKSDLELARRETDAQIAEIQATMIQTRAEVVPLEAETRRLRQAIADNEKTMATRKEALARAREELAREENLRARGASSDSNVKAFQDKVNLREQEVQDVESTAAQLPFQIQAQDANKEAILSNIQRLEAQRDIANSKRDQLELDLTRTTVVSPADGLVLMTEPTTGATARKLTPGDVVQAGQDVAWILPTEEGMEIPVPIRTEQARWIRDLRSLLDYHAEDPGPGVEGVRIEWVADPRYAWEGKILRFTGTIDTATRRLTAIVKVDRTGEEFVPDESVPLTLGMYCRVLLPSVEHSRVVVVPRRIVREGAKEGEYNVLVVAGAEGADGQGIRAGHLEVRPVEILRQAGDDVVVASGLKTGEILVASSLDEVVPGMDLRFRER